MTTSISQRASNEFLRLLRERQGALTELDIKAITGMYVAAGMDKAKVEQWLQYTIARMPRAENVQVAKTCPVIDMPLPESAPVALPEPHGLMQLVSDRLRIGAQPAPASADDFKLPQ